MRKKLCMLLLTLSLLISSSIFAAESNGIWKHNKKGWWYEYSDKSYITNDWLTYKNKKYYFNNIGYMVTGWKKINNKWYFFTSSGEMITGWRKISGIWYWFDNNGIMQTGFKEINNKTYYFNSNGAMQIGWQTIDGNKYYFSPNGYMSTNWKKYNNKWYYFDSTGKMITGWRTIKNIKYYFNDSGIMLTGFQTIDNNTYYFNKDGGLQTGFLNIQDKYYYFDETGIMQTELQNFDNQLRCFSTIDGHMITGFKTINNNTYYFDPNNQGFAYSGWLLDHSSIYYFDDSYKMITGLHELLKNGQINLYYFNFNGEMQIGWQQINDNYYYFNEDGEALFGFQTIDNDTYYFNENGQRYSGELIIDNIKYQFNEDGKLVDQYDISDEHQCVYEEYDRLEPSCFSRGLIYYECPICGNEKIERIPAIGHHTWNDTYIIEYENYHIRKTQEQKIYIGDNGYNFYEHGYITKQQVKDKIEYDMIHDTPEEEGGCGCYGYHSEYIYITIEPGSVDKNTYKICDVCGQKELIDSEHILFYSDEDDPIQIENE